MTPVMRGCAKCGKRRGVVPASFLPRENEMKTVEVLTKAGIIAVREKDLKMYKARGCTMSDGIEIETLEERLAREEAEKKAKTNKKKPKE
jgi:hypothetical protein